MSRRSDIFASPLRARPHPWRSVLLGNVPLVVILIALIPLGSLIEDNLDPYYLRMLMLIGFNIMLAVSLQLINGFSGQFSLGHAGFMAVGAYLAAFPAIEYSKSFEDPATTVLFFVSLGISVGIGAAVLWGIFVAIRLTRKFHRALPGILLMMLVAWIVADFALAARLSAPHPVQPDDLTSSDINVRAPGKTELTAAKDFSLAGDGEDIGGTSADGFHYAYREVSGDFDVQVQVTSLSRVVPGTRAGLMARTDLTAGSQMIFVGSTSSDGYRFNFRQNAGAIGAYVKYGSVSYPNVWVRMVRSGNVFTGYYGTDGEHWTEMQSLDGSLPPTIYLGLAICSHRPSVAAQATLRDLSLAFAAPRWLVWSQLASVLEKLFSKIISKGQPVAERISAVIPDKVNLHFWKFRLRPSICFIVLLYGAGCCASAVGFVVGLPALRLRGDYLAIATLGFGEIIRIGIQNSAPLGGALGLTSIPKFTDFAWLYAVVIITVVTIWRIAYSSKGRAIMAVREDEIAASSIGVNTTTYKVMAFTIGAFFAGVAGALFSLHERSITPGYFNVIKSIEPVVMVTLGGLGSISGAILAAIVLTLLPEILRGISPQDRMVIYSVLLVVIMILRPQGLLGGFELWPRRRGPLRKVAPTAKEAVPA